MMSDDLELRIARLEAAQQDSIVQRVEGLERESKARAFRAITILEKILLPVVLALLTWFAKQTSDKIAEAQVRVADKNVQVLSEQLNLAKDRHAAERADAKDLRRLRYLEFFFRDLHGGDPQKVQNSLALLYSVEPETARTLADAVVASPATDPRVRNDVRRLSFDLDRIGPLINFRLVIYHDRERVELARQLKIAIQNLGFPQEVSLAEKPVSFAGDSAAYGFNYRFDQVYERSAAEYLGRLLRLAAPAETFKPLPVNVNGVRTDGTLTIFLFRPSA